MGLNAASPTTGARDPDRARIPGSPPFEIPLTGSQLYPERAAGVTPKKKPLALLRGA